MQACVIYITVFLSIIAFVIVYNEIYVLFVCAIYATVFISIIAFVIVYNERYVLFVCAIYASAFHFEMLLQYHYTFILEHS